MTDEQLREAVNRAVEAGLGTAMATRASEWDAAYLEVQRKRLLRLLERWLDIEKLRMPFEVVASERDLKGVRVGPLRLNVRMDRVDRVDGRLVLIDYKTGTAEVKQWMGERPDRPQVPLYALLANELEAGLEADPAPKLEPGPEETDQLSLAAGAGEVGPGGERLGLGAVGFASVRAGKFLKLQGLEAQSGLLVRAGRGKKPVMDATTFEGQVELWEQVLTALAEEYARGDARVRPKNYPVTCQHCGQRMLCRLDASLLEEMEEDEEENGEEENG
jgi:ATP-dependent helicase/DNAse subunit B